MYCSNCGSKLDDDSKFCKECGTKVEKDNNVDVKKKKKEILKCSSCGEILDSFVVRCPSCGKEIKNIGKSKTLFEFEEKLNLCPNNKKKAEFIRNFVVPASREDLLNFLVVAKINIIHDDINADGNLDEEELLLAKAWVFQLHQCYEKARLTFGDTNEFEYFENGKNEIEQHYQQMDFLEKKKHDEFRINEKKKTYENSQSVKFLSALSFICSITAFVLAIICYETNFLGILFSSIMILTFILSILFGLQIIKTGRNCHSLFLVLNFALLIPYLITFDFSSFSSRNFSTISYDTFILYEQFPAYENNYGIIYTNSSSCLDVKFEGDKDNLVNYTYACKEFGYVIEMENSASYFEAYNDDGYKIIVEYRQGVKIKIEAPMIMYNISWPTSKIVSYLPNPDKTNGNIIINSDDKFSVYLSDFSYIEYKEYVKACIALGYETEKYKEKEYKCSFTKWFVTYYIEVEYIGNSIVFINIYKY